MAHNASSEYGISPSPYAAGQGEKWSRSKENAGYYNNDNVAEGGIPPNHKADAIVSSEPEKLHRTLKSRQVSMLALGAAIGTGLIIGSGAGLAHSGPVGLFLAYVFVGSLCFAMLAVSGLPTPFLLS